MFQPILIFIFFVIVPAVPKSWVCHCLYMYKLFLTGQCLLNTNLSRSLHTWENYHLIINSFDRGTSNTSLFGSIQRNVRYICDLRRKIRNLRGRSSWSLSKIKYAFGNFIIMIRFNLQVFENIIKALIIIKNFLVFIWQAAGQMIINIISYLLFLFLFSVYYFYLQFNSLYS